MSNKSENQNPTVLNFSPIRVHSCKENLQPHLMHPLRPSIKSFLASVDLDERNSRVQVEGPLRKKPHLQFQDDSNLSVLNRGFLAENCSSFLDSERDSENETSGSFDSDSQPLPDLAPLKLKFDADENEDDLSLITKKFDATAIKSDSVSSNSDSIIDSETSSSAYENPLATPDNEQRASSTINLLQAPLKKIIPTPKTTSKSAKKLFE